ncbi:hypothetical protein Tsubulata_024004 [Turnera subulata]|uniref:TPX2 C-terminal domain-containing protein n=1 Tax=Turnera subulata TaxID=218843 RepID=A0A9Q0FS07_9ROSI|nr:hypothetical protein Tsubulata_024004 [Turnera subulata]
MGEPACLRRSFSHPSSASREGKEGDPYKALTESISFGRFMSESLAWEKWSTFSHNRYLEEVEQCSKPGSVAQKKAFFEAHYKKRAAMKAAALLEQAGAEANVIPEMETDDEAHDNSAMNLECEEATSDMVINEQPERSMVDTEPAAHSADTVTFYSTGQRDNLQTAKVESDEEMAEQSLEYIKSTDDTVMEEQEKDLLDSEGAYSADADHQKDCLHNENAIKGEEKTVHSIEVENPVQVENAEGSETAKDSHLILAAPEKKMDRKETSEKKNLAVPSNKRQLNASPKSSSQSRASKLPKSSTKHTSSNQPKAGENVPPSSKKSVVDLMDKKRSTLKSVHMSINFDSCSGGSKKNPPSLSRNSNSVSRNPTRASILGASNLHTPANRQSEEKRTKASLNKSVSGGILANRTSQGPPGNSKSSNASGSKARPPIVASPFSFRSEERAEKRKEFFRKLEEKNNAKEAEQAHPRSRLKDKAENDHKMLRQSTGFRSKPSEDLCHGLQSPRNYLKKVNHVMQNQMTRPRSPKPARKPTPSDIHETSSGLPRRPPVNAESSKRGVQKRSQSVSRSVSLVPSKKAHENASPNIQR